MKLPEFNVMMQRIVYNLLLKELNTVLHNWLVIVYVFVTFDDIMYICFQY